MPGGRFEKPKKFAHFDIHHWADWIELGCLEDIDEEISREDIEKRLVQGLDCDDEEIAGAVPEEIDEEDLDIVTDDKVHAQVAGWFDHLRGRVQLFGSAYPFVLNGDAITLRLRRRLSLPQKIYLSMLMMANLHYFQPAERNQFAADFELLSAAALRNYLPSKAKVHVFGKSGAVSSRYNGSAFQRVCKLAEDLQCSLLTSEGEFAARDSGDKGLDIVAWLPWADQSKEMFIIFGGCGCTPQWKVKQHSSEPTNWCSNKMTKPGVSVNAVFSPYFLRRGSGEWQRVVEMGPYLHIDRLRITELIGMEPRKVAHLSSLTKLEKLRREKATSS